MNAYELGKENGAFRIYFGADFSKQLVVHRLEVYLERKLCDTRRPLGATGRVGLPSRVGRVVLADFDAEV
jgi:hypothetical protein